MPFSLSKIKGHTGKTVVLSPSEKGFTQTGNNWLSLGANSFLIKYTRFQKGTGVQERKQEFTLAVSFTSKH